MFQLGARLPTTFSSLLLHCDCTTIHLRSLYLPSELAVFMYYEGQEGLECSILLTIFSL